MFVSGYWHTRYFKSPYWPRGGEGNTVFEIDDKSRRHLLQAGTCTIDDTLNSRNVCSFTLIKSDSFTPIVGQEVIIHGKMCTEWARIFGGTIENVTKRNAFKGSQIFYDVECTDFNQLADKRVVFYIYEDMEVAEIVTHMIEVFMDGDNITLGPWDSEANGLHRIRVEKAVFSYKKISTCLNEISKLTGLMWYIDYYKVLHLVARSVYYADFSIRDDQNLVSETFCEWWRDKIGQCNEGMDYGRIRVNENREQLSNEQYVIAGNDTTDLLQDEFAGDDERRTFTLRYMLSNLKRDDDGDIADDAIRYDIGAGWVNATVGERDKETGKQFYYTKGEKEIIQDDGETVLADTDKLEVNYQGLRPIVVRERDQQSIDDRANLENSSGIYARVHDDESIESEDFAQQFAEGLIRRFKEVPQKVEFTTDQKILFSGQMIDIVLPEFEVNGRHNAIPLPTDFLIDSVKISDMDSILWRLDVTTLSGEHLGSWQEFFQKLELFGRQLKLNEQQKLLITSGTDLTGQELVAKDVFTVDDGETVDFDWTPAGSPLEPTDDMETEVCSIVGFGVVGKSPICLPEGFELGLHEA